MPHHPQARSALPLLSVLLSLCLSACIPSQATPEASAPPPPPTVHSLSLQARDVAVPVEYAAQIAGSRQVVVRARVEGILLKRTYQEGQAVKAGSVLFEIDPVPFQVTLEQTRANLAEQEARLAQTERELKRVLPLFAEKAVSQRERDSALSERDQAQAAVRSAKAAVREAEINLSYTKVLAPISGITSQEARSEGSLVRPGDESGELTTIAQLDPIYVNFSYSDNELLSLRQAQAEGKITMNEGVPLQVNLTLADGSRYPLTGQINFTDSIIDSRTGTVKARAQFANPDGRLLPGQFVRVQIQGITRKQALLVPQKAVMQAPNGQFVYVLNQQSQVEMRPIQTGQSLGADWIVEQGLQPGDEVVLDNLLKIAPGAPVQRASAG